MRLYKYIRKRLLSPVAYAREIGVNLGENCFVPDKETWSSEPYLITVGNHCQITAGVRIFTHGGGMLLREKFPDFDSFGKVYIGNYVYIGNNALIMPGITIGDHVIVAAGAVVTKSLPSGVVVAGNPAKVVCSIEQYIERNTHLNVHTFGMSAKEKMNYIKHLPESAFIKKPNIEYSFEQKSHRIHKM